MAHCKDCCCDQSWKALGIDTYTGKSIPEHITTLTHRISELEADIRDNAQYRDEAVQHLNKIEELEAEREKDKEHIRSLLSEMYCDTCDTDLNSCEC